MDVLETLDEGRTGDSGLRRRDGKGGRGRVVWNEFDKGGRSPRDLSPTKFWDTVKGVRVYGNGRRVSWVTGEGKTHGEGGTDRT